MLSTKVLSDVDEAVKYYTSKDNYYTDGEGYFEKSFWYGKGSESLGIKGQHVDRDLFRDLLKGKLPSGEQLGRKEGDEISHRPGFDLTFNVPKRVSMLSLFSQDPELQKNIDQAILTATRNTLDVIEKECTQVRLKQKGNISFANTENFVSALFVHDLSRSGDPSLHVHAVIMNMTQRWDKVWRSLASQIGEHGREVERAINGFIERVRHNKNQYGLIFRSELAYELKGMNVPIETTNRKHGFFDVLGISKASAERYCTRSEEIRQYMQENGLEGAKAAAFANSVTKAPKYTIDRSQLMDNWKLKEVLGGSSVPAFAEVNAVVKKIKSINSGEGIDPDKAGLVEIPESVIKMAKEAVTYAMDHLSERGVKIDAVALMNVAINYASEGTFNVASMSKAIDGLKESGELIALQGDSEGQYYTTKKILDYEKALVSMLGSKENSSRGLFSDLMDRFMGWKESEQKSEQKSEEEHEQNKQNKKNEQAGQHQKDKSELNTVVENRIDAFLLSKSHLTEEQILAVKTLFNADYRIRVLEGQANTGKSTLIKPMMELSKLLGYRPIVLSQSKAKSVSLKESFQDSVESVSDFIKNFLKSAFDNSEHRSMKGFMNTQQKYIDEKKAILDKKMIFVDNAHLLPTKQMLDFSQMLEKINASCIFIGDRRAYLGAKPSDPFGQILDNNVFKASLKNYFDGKVIKENKNRANGDNGENRDNKENKENKNNTENNNHAVKSAIEDTLQNNIDRAFEKIGNRILSVKDKEMRNAQMATHYASLSKEERRETILVGQTQPQANDLNLAVRKVLKNTKEIGGEDFSFKTLQPVFMGETAARLAQSYKVGQWVRFYEDVKSLKIKNGDYLKITHVNRGNNTVFLVHSENKIKNILEWAEEKGIRAVKEIRDRINKTAKEEKIEERLEKGKKEEKEEKEEGRWGKDKKEKKEKNIEWDPKSVAGLSGKVGVFEEKETKLSVGETIVCRVNHYQKNILNGEKFRIDAMQGSDLVLQRQNGRRVAIDFNKDSHRHFDYGYATTAHRGDKQRITQDKPNIAIVFLSAHSRQSDQRQLYHTISQAKFAFIYTEDRSKLLGQIAAQSGDKQNASDVLDTFRLTQHAKGLPENSSELEHQAILEDAYRKSIKTLVPESFDQFLKNTEKKSQKDFQAEMPLDVKEVTKEGVEKKKAGSAQELDQQKRDELEKKLSKKFVSYARLHLGERESSFDHRDVLSEALKNTLGDARRADIEKAVFAAEKSGDLVRGLASINGMVWTTPEEIALEKEVIALAKEGQAQVTPLFPEGKLEYYLSKMNPKSDHKVVMREWLSSTDRVLLLQGRAGTGKTTLLEHVKSLLMPGSSGENNMRDMEKHGEESALLRSAAFLKDLSQDYKVLCLAPTNTAANELRSRGLLAQTVESFLQEQRAQYNGVIPLNPKTIEKHGHRLIVAVDESSMVSNARSLELLTFTKNMEARLLGVGDYKQYGAIESGKPHHLLQSVGVKTLFLDDIVRQKNPKLLEAVLQTYEGNFRKVFDLLKDNVKEIGEEERPHGEKLDNPEIRLREVAKQYLGYSMVERAQTGLVTLTNSHRRWLNTMITSGLQENGELSGPGLTAEIYVPKDMTKVQQSMAVHYSIGDILRFTRKNHSLGVEAGEHLKISEINEKENTLILKKQDGRTVIFKINAFDEETRGRNDQNNKIVSEQNKQWRESNKVVEAYYPEERHIFVGHLIRWTRSDKKNGLIGSELAIVKAIEGTKMTLEPTKLSDKGFMPSGEVFTVDTMNPKFKHWDFSYSITGFGVQAGTFKRILAVIESYSKFLTSQKSFLILLTRASEEFYLFTDNAKKLLSRILYTKADKTSSLESIGQVKMNNDQEKAHQEKIVSKAMRADHFKFQNQDHHKIDAKKQSMINQADKILEQSKSINGTLAEQYLRKHCHINLDHITHTLFGLRFHPGIYSEINQSINPALVLVATDSKLKTKGIQVIFLDEKTGKKAGLKEAKQTFGDLLGASVKLNYLSINKNVGVVAERLEDGLSILEKTKKFRIDIVLGKPNMMKAIENNECAKKVVCLSNEKDRKELIEKKMFQSLKNRESERGDVLVLMLDRERKFKRNERSDKTVDAEKIEKLGATDKEKKTEKSGGIEKENRAKVSEINNNDSSASQKRVNHDTSDVNNSNKNIDHKMMERMVEQSVKPTDFEKNSHDQHLEKINGSSKLNEKDVEAFKNRELLEFKQENTLSQLPRKSRRMMDILKDHVSEKDIEKIINENKVKSEGQVRLNNENYKEMALKGSKDRGDIKQEPIKSTPKRSNEKLKDFEQEL